MKTLTAKTEKRFTFFMPDYDDCDQHIVQNSEEVTEKHEKVPAE